MINESEILHLCKYIIKTIQSVCVKKNFVIANFNSMTGEILNPNVNTDDIADYLLFIIWFCKITNNKDILEWATNQFKLQKNLLQSKSGFYTEYSVGNKIPSKTNFQFIHVKYQEDYPIGSIPSYILTNDRIFFEGTELFLNGLIKYAIDNRGYIRNKIFPALRIKYPFASSECLGLFMEGLVDMFSITKNKIYLESAKKISYALTENPCFIKQGFFPNGWNTILRKPTRSHKKSSKKFDMMKPNTNSMFGLLSLYRITKENYLESAIRKWLTSVKKMEYTKAVFYNSWDIKKRKACGIVHKTTNHAILDVLIESYLTLNDKKYLKIAIAGSKWWIKRNRDGLIPDGIKNQKEWEISMIDSHADLTIIFLKLYQITNDENFLDCALTNLKALNSFRDRCGLAWKVNTQTGKISDHMNKTKFLGGCLKSLLTGYITLKNKKIYEDKLLRMLTRDR